MYIIKGCGQSKPAKTLNTILIQCHCLPTTTLFTKLPYTPFTGAQDVMTLKVKCENQHNGCPWEGELYSIEDHMKRCDHTILLCPNKCECNQEITKLQRGQLETHINTECPRRQYKCPYCEEMGEYEERMNLHLNRCPKVTLECTNEECRERVLRCEMERHKSECEFQRTPCKFARFGCDLELPKRELKTHEDDEGMHLQSTKEKVLELMDELEKQEVKFTEEIKQQENKINSLTAAPLNKAKTFELTKYRKYKVGNKPFHSPSFYSSSKGYRLSISVNANGLDRVEGTHVSVYAHVERGVNDDSLTWPFQGSVTVELLNQLEDKNHKQYIIKFPQDEEVSGRVMGMVRKRGWGTTHFIAHRHLGHKPHKNCQYLKDNKLVFRVATQLPDYKPWLECDM